MISIELQFILFATHLQQSFDKKNIKVHWYQCHHKNHLK